MADQISADIWVNDVCLVCQTKCQTKEEKDLHENDTVHKRKAAVHHFLANELTDLKTAPQEHSALRERYYRAGVVMAGLECICEFQFPGDPLLLWACTVCYVAGTTLEEADLHLYSSQHTRTYMNEYYPDDVPTFLKAIEAAPPADHGLVEQGTILKILQNEANRDLLPDVYVITETEKPRAWALSQLGIESQEPELEYCTESVGDETSNFVIVLCKICGQCFFSNSDSVLADAWRVHCSTQVHQRHAQIRTIIHDANPETRSSGELSLALRTEFQLVELQQNGGYRVGPTCGLEFLIVFDDDKDECFCKLCASIIKREEIVEHFSSEGHLSNLIRPDYPGSMQNSEYLSHSDACDVVNYCLKTKFGIDSTDESQPPSTQTVAPNAAGEFYLLAKGPIPSLLRRLARTDSPQHLFLVNLEAKCIDLGDGIRANFCEQCCELVKNEDWSDHIFCDAHYKLAARRALFNIDRSISFLSISTWANAHFAESMVQPSWDDQPLGTIGEAESSLGVLTVQDHLDFGLQFVVEDRLSKKLICTCCLVDFDVADENLVSLHLRSLHHILRTLHRLPIKSLVSAEWRSAPNRLRELVLEFFTSLPLDGFYLTTVTSFDPLLARRLAFVPGIHKYVLHLSVVPPSKRVASIAFLNDEDADESTGSGVGGKSLEDGKFVAIVDVLRICSIEALRVHATTGDGGEGVHFFCQECQQSFFSYQSPQQHQDDDVHKLLTEHLLSKSHFDRAKIFRENPIDENQRIRARFSKIEAPQFVQPTIARPGENTTWLWADRKATYEFVFAQVGVKEIKERRNFLVDGKPSTDLFCTLCAQSLRPNKLDLQDHIRSFSHVFNCIQKNAPQKVFPRLQQILSAPTKPETKNRRIRRLIDFTVKFLVDKTRERISIYDLKPHSFEEPDVENGVKEFQENHGKRSAKLLIPPIGEDFSAITKYFEDLLISECGPSKPLQIAANDSAGSRKDFIGKLLETVQNCLNPPKDESFMTLEQTLEKVCSVRHFDGKQEREDTPDNASNSVERDVSDTEESSSHGNFSLTKRHGRESEEFGQKPAYLPPHIRNRGGGRWDAGRGYHYRGGRPPYYGGRGGYRPAGASPQRFFIAREKSESNANFIPMGRGGGSGLFSQFRPPHTSPQRSRDRESPRGRGDGGERSPPGNDADSSGPPYHYADKFRQPYSISPPLVDGGGGGKKNGSSHREERSSSSSSRYRHRTPSGGNDGEDRHYRRHHERGGGGRGGHSPPFEDYRRNPVYHPNHSQSRPRGHDFTAPWSYEQWSPVNDASQGRKSPTNRDHSKQQKRSSQEEAKKLGSKKDGSPRKRKHGSSKSEEKSEKKKKRHHSDKIDRKTKGGKDGGIHSSGKKKKKLAKKNSSPTESEVDSDVMFSPSSSSSSSSNDDDDDGRGLARPKLINRKADGGGGNKLQTPKIKINPPKQLQAILAQPPEVLVRQEQQLQSQIRNAPSRIRLVQGGHQRRVSGEDEEEGEVRDEALAIPISPESSDEQQPPFAPSSSNNIMGRNASLSTMPAMTTASIGGASLLQPPGLVTPLPLSSSPSQLQQSQGNNPYAPPMSRAAVLAQYSAAIGMDTGNMSSATAGNLGGGRNMLPPALSVSCPPPPAPFGGGLTLQQNVSVPPPHLRALGGGPVSSGSYVLGGPGVGSMLMAGMPPFGGAIYSGSNLGAGIHQQQSLTTALFGGFQTPPPIQQRQLTAQEAVLKARADVYARDLVNIQSVDDLIAYIWNQSSDPISPDERTLLFNDVVKKQRGLLGANTLYQIVCYNAPELETYYCSMCNHWMTVSDCFLHLCSSMHLLNFMQRNYKVYHKKAVDAPTEEAREKIIRDLADNVWKVEGSGACVNRMRCILNVDTFRRLWPTYEESIDSSWKLMQEGDLEILMTMKQKKAEESLRQNEPQISEVGTDGGDDRRSVERSDRRRRSRSQDRDHHHSRRYGSRSPSHASSSRASSSTTTTHTHRSNRDRENGDRGGEHRRSRRNEQDRHRRGRSRDPPAGRERDRSRDRGRSRDPAGRDPGRSRDRRGRRHEDEEEGDARTKLSSTSSSTSARRKDDDFLRNLARGLDGTTVDSDGKRGNAATSDRRSAAATTGNGRTIPKGQPLIRKVTPPDSAPAASSHHTAPQTTASSSKTVNSQRLRPDGGNLTSADQTRRVIGTICMLQEDYERNGGHLSAHQFFKVCRDVELDETFVRRNSMLRETATTFGLNLDDPLPPQQLDEGGNGTGGTGPSISQKLNLSAEARKLLLLFDGAASASGGGSGGQLIRPAPQRPSTPQNPTIMAHFGGLRGCSPVRSSFTPTPPHGSPIVGGVGHHQLQSPGANSPQRFYIPSSNHPPQSQLQQPPHQQQSGGLSHQPFGMSGSSTASVQPWTIPPVLQSSSNPIWQKPGPSTILAATSSVGTVFAGGAPPPPTPIPIIPLVPGGGGGDDWNSLSQFSATLGVAGPPPLADPRLQLLRRTSANSSSTSPSPAASSSAGANQQQPKKKQ